MHEDWPSLVQRAFSNEFIASKALHFTSKFRDVPLCGLANSKITWIWGILDFREDICRLTKEQT